MIRRHEDVIPCPPCPPCPPFPPTPIIPVVSVSSVNGLTGDIVLKNLIIGDQAYNGSDEVVITLEDLGLETAVRYLGALRTEEDIFNLDDINEGDLYFCLKNKLLYLCTDRRSRTWISIRIALSDEDIRTISINGERLEVVNGNVDIPAASRDIFGTVKLGEEFSIRPKDGCLIMNFENVAKGTIDVSKLKGDLWLTCDANVELPDKD